MRKLLLALAVLVCALVAAYATPASNANTTRAASNIAPACNFSGGRYKYSGSAHFEGTSPTFTSYALNQTVQYWIFAGAPDHLATYLGISTYSGTTATGWVQAGTLEGYDNWGDQISNNYPIGIWSNATHPFDGHAGGSRGTAGNGPVYTPSGGFVSMRYVESMTSAGERLQMLGVQITGNGVTTKILNNGNHVFSMVDQNGNTIGGAGGAGDHISIPAGVQYTGGPAGYQVFMGQENYDASLNYCGYVEANLDHFGSNDTTYGAGGFWSNYYGCSGNLWNGDNPGNPACSGGAGSPSAPLDVEWYTQSGLLTQYVYCAEGIGHGPPFIVRNAAGDPIPLVTSAAPTLPPVNKTSKAAAPGVVGGGARGGGAPIH